MMKKRLWLIGLVAVVIGIGVYAAESDPDGSTRESREELIQEIPHGKDWQIAVEQTLGEHIICGIYSADERYGIAVFEPTGNGKYQLKNWDSRNLDRILITTAHMDEQWYDLVWLWRSDLDYAEITYSRENAEQEPIRHEAETMEIFVHPSLLLADPPSYGTGDYTLHVVYYDNDGNKIE